MDDEYLMYALSFGIQNNLTAERQVRTKLTRALAANAGVVKLISQHQQPVKVQDTETGEWHETLALRIDAQRVHQALEHIGRALHYHHFKTKWLQKIQVVPLFLLSLEGDAPQIFNADLEVMGQAVEDLLSEIRLSGANPEVFTYKVTKPGQQIPVVILLNFYEGSKVVLLFKS
jgi:hypothetical protein